MRNIGYSRQHVNAHVSQHKPFGIDLIQMIDYRGIVKVVSHIFVVEVGLCDEKIGFPSDLDQVVGPLRIPRISDNAVIYFNPIGKTGIVLSQSASFSLLILYCS